MTSWPGIRDDMVNAGATWLDQKVVRHGNWVTSRGPQDMVPFVEAMTELFSGAAGTQVVNETARSDPQRDQPPALVVNAMRWLPRPAFRVILGVVLLGAGIVAVDRRRSGDPLSQSPGHHRLGQT
jgi:protease I